MTLTDEFRQMSAAASLLYRDKATIYSVLPFKTDRGTINQLVAIKDGINIPCKLSRSNQRASKSGLFGTDEYDAKIYMANGIHVPAGAVIDVTDANDNVVRYKRSSASYASYLSHQEITIVRDEKAKGKADG